jgi:hypothetical protein
MKKDLYFYGNNLSIFHQPAIDRPLRDRLPLLQGLCKEEGSLLRLPG